MPSFRLHVRIAVKRDDRGAGVPDGPHRGRAASGGRDRAPASGTSANRIVISEALLSMAHGGTDCHIQRFNIMPHSDSAISIAP